MFQSGLRAVQSGKLCWEQLVLKSKPCSSLVKTYPLPAVQDVNNLRSNMMSSCSLISQTIHPSFESNVPLGNRFQRLLARPLTSNAAPFISLQHSVCSAPLLSHSIGVAQSELFKRSSRQSSPGASTFLRKHRFYQTRAKGLDNEGVPFSQLDVTFLSIPKGGKEGSAPAANEAVTAGRWEVATPKGLGGCLLYYRSFYDLFVQFAAHASNLTWGEEDGPFSDLEGELKWLSPDLGPRAQEFRKSAGTSELFGFMVCFPDSPDALLTTSQLLLSVFLVDDWIERQSAHEACQLADWWRGIARQSESGAPFDSDRASETLPPSLSADPSVQKAGALCILALAGANERAAQVDPAWFTRFAWASHEYAQAVVSEVETARAFRETGTPPRVHEYLAYRCFSSGFIPLPIFAALQRGIRLSDARFERARVLLVCASLVSCCFNDTFVAAKDAAAGLVNLVKIVWPRRAVDMHNVLVDCLCEEANEFLATATEGDESQRFVDLLQASMFGCNLWHNITPRYRKYLEVTRQPFGLIDGPEGTLSAEHGELKREMRELIHRLTSAKVAGSDHPG